MANGYGQLALDGKIYYFGDEVDRSNFDTEENQQVEQILFDNQISIDEMVKTD